jgi:hypothetical protein
VISSTRWFEEPADQVPAAVHLQLSSRLGFQLADGGRDVTGEDGRVCPLRVGERGRCHVLGPRVQRRCDGVARICHYSPVAGKDLVGGPAEQEGVGALADLVDERRGLVVEERQSPSATLESALRSSSGPPRPCITPSRETFVMVVSFTVTGPFSWFGRPSVQAHRRTDLIDHGTVRRREAGSRGAMRRCGFSCPIAAIRGNPLKWAHRDSDAPANRRFLSSR